MNLQKYLFRVEEAKALYDLYEQTESGRAQGSAMALAYKDQADADPEQVAQMDQAMDQLTARVVTLEKLLFERVGAKTIDEVIDQLNLHMARVEQFRKVRQEQAALKVALELEIAMGTIAPEQRKDAEAALVGMQQRLETLTHQGVQALPGPRLITV